MERCSSDSPHRATCRHVVSDCAPSGPGNIHLSGFRALFCNYSGCRRLCHVRKPNRVCRDARLTSDGYDRGNIPDQGAVDRRHQLFAGSWLIMGITLGVVVSRAVFAPGRVTLHHVMGAVLLYLAIAITFVALFTFIGSLVPKAFSGLSLEDSPALASNLIYFSFATLTTTGYGDIFPVHPIARSLCNLEAIFGQLYPATLLARLVTLELAGRDR